MDNNQPRQVDRRGDVETLTKELEIPEEFNLNESICKTLPHVQHNALENTARAIYQEYLRLFSINQNLNEQVEKQGLERNELAAKYNDFRTIDYEQTIKRKRRQAVDITRLYYCPINKCRKEYGSEGSLTHHVRLKHLQFYTSGQFQLFIDGYIKQLIKKQDLSKEDNKLQLKVKGRKGKKEEGKVE